MEGVKIKLKEDETNIPCEKCGRMMVIKPADSVNSSRARVIRSAKHKAVRNRDNRHLPGVRRQGDSEKSKKDIRSSAAKIIPNATL